MSLVEEIHEQRKARLIRMGAYKAPKAYNPPPAPVEPTIYPARSVQPLHYHEMWFFDLVTWREPAPAEAPRIDTIQRAVARHYEVTKNDLICARRNAYLVRPRHVAMYLCKILTLRSMPQIGDAFGDRDHTTILHATRKIERLLPIDENLRRDVAIITSGLR